MLKLAHNRFGDLKNILSHKRKPLSRNYFVYFYSLQHKEGLSLAILIIQKQKMKAILAAQAFLCG